MILASSEHEKAVLDTCDHFDNIAIDQIDEETINDEDKDVHTQKDEDVGEDTKILLMK